MSEIEVEFRTVHSATYPVPPDCRVTVGTVFGHRLRVFGGVCDGSGNPTADPATGLPHWFTAVLDTGAPVSFFPEHVWTGFRQHIRFWPDRCEADAPAWLRALSGFGGQGGECHIGEIELRFHDHLGQSLPPVTVLSKFAKKPEAVREIILGLGGGSFDPFRLEVDFSRTAAKLVMA